MKEKINYNSLMPTQRTSTVVIVIIIIDLANIIIKIFIYTRVMKNFSGCENALTTM